MSSTSQVDPETRQRYSAQTLNCPPRELPHVVYDLEDLRSTQPGEPFALARFERQPDADRFLGELRGELLAISRSDLAGLLAALGGARCRAADAELADAGTYRRLERGGARNVTGLAARHEQARERLQDSGERLLRASRALSESTDPASLLARLLPHLTDPGRACPSSSSAPEASEGTPATRLPSEALGSPIADARDGSLARAAA